MNIKNRIEELIGSIHTCTTKAGVEEIGKLYAQKKKELGANITPMMDIRVRDAIAGKCDMFDSEAAEREEAKKAKEAENAAAEVAGKFDEGLHVTTEKDFFLHETVVVDGSIDAMCIMELEMSIPTSGHHELQCSFEEAAEHVGARARTIISEDTSCIIPIDERIEIVETFTESSEVVKKGVLFAEIDALIANDVTRVFAFVEQHKIPEYRRLGKHFLRSGGHRFEIVEIKNKTPSSYVEQCVRDDNLRMFIENSPVDSVYAENIFDRALEQILEG